MQTIKTPKKGDRWFAKIKKKNDDRFKQFGMSNAQCQREGEVSVVVRKSGIGRKSQKWCPRTPPRALPLGPPIVADINHGKCD